MYKVTYNGKKQIVDVKHGIFSLTDIPYSQQVWTGWPENTNDNTTLATAGISYPVHHLSVKTSTDAVVNNNKKAKRSVSRVCILLNNNTRINIFKFAFLVYSANIVCINRIICIISKFFVFLLI